MTATYWEIACAFCKAKGEARADYGQQLIQQLKKDLSRQFGLGFGRANLWHVRAFHRARREGTILQTPSGEPKHYTQSTNPKLADF